MDHRKRIAAEEARPLRDQAKAKSQQAAQWSQRVAAPKKTKPRDDQAINHAEAQVRELARESRELAAEAEEIEDAVYDLKAVNPHKRPIVDTRTPTAVMLDAEATSHVGLAKRFR